MTVENSVLSRTVNTSFRMITTGRNIIDEKNLLLLCYNNGYISNKKHITQYLANKTYSQYLYFKNIGNKNAAWSNYKIFLEIAFFSDIFYFALKNSRKVLQLRYYIARFSYYIIHPKQFYRFVLNKINVIIK